MIKAKYMYIYTMYIEWNLPHICHALQLLHDTIRMTGGDMMFDRKLASHTVRQMRLPPQCGKEDGAEGAIANTAVYIEYMSDIGYTLQ